PISRRDRSRCGRPPTLRPPNTSAGSMPPRSTSPPGTFSKSCCRNVSRRRSNCRPLRSTGHCGGARQTPFFFFSPFAGFSIVGSSPEILVRVREGTVTVRPLAGTRPRGTTLQQDRALESELLADEKERAEHLMLLDLGRNDVGRVARTATVKVTDQFSVERFSQVMHIVSNVEGQLDGKYDALDALAAGFPAGTVSGAPKVRAMEIIDELEPDKRGLYAGSVGYFSAAGELDSCIVLRTALI